MSELGDFHVTLTALRVIRDRLMLIVVERKLDHRCRLARSGIG